MSEIVELKSFVEKKDLEVFTSALYKQYTELTVKCAQLEEQVAHLEELLKAVETVPIIGVQKCE